jgi:hypothetical protein
VKYLAASPATDRLGWLLDGLNGVPGWGGGAARVRQRAAGLRG